jgi:hypothetical protein
MVIVRKLWTAAAIVVACILVAVLYIQKWIPRSIPNVAIEKGGSCNDPLAKKGPANPNQMLFVTCGGFLN